MTKTGREWGMGQGQTFRRNLVRELQDLLRPPHNHPLLRLPRRLREQHGRDVRERERAQHEERVQEAHVLVRDAAGPEGREEARLCAQGGVGEQRGGRRQLPNGRAGLAFRGIQEEDEDEEE